MTSLEDDEGIAPLPEDIYDTFQEPIVRNTDVTVLRRAWMCEKAAPELLKYELAVVERLKTKVEGQEDDVNAGAEDNINNAFMANLYHMELERIQFMLRSYHRVRLLKIQANVRDIVRRDSLTRTRLSAHELTFAVAYKAMLDSHFQASCLSGIPENLQKLDDKGMVAEASLDAHVVFRVDDTALGAFELGGHDDEPIELVQGDIFLARYRQIASLVEDGRVSLL